MVTWVYTSMAREGELRGRALLPWVGWGAGGSCSAELMKEGFSGFTFLGSWLFWF